MNVFFLSLFPEMFSASLDHSILGRAKKAGLFSYQIINPRDFSQRSHQGVDDTPYGGGPGMVMEVGPVYNAYQKALKLAEEGRARTILLAPTGKRFSQKEALRLNQYDHLIFICGHYEGVDERIAEYADETMSLGDYVLTGGELASIVITDAIVRTLPGVLGHEEGAIDESFSEHLLEHPQYTRPPIFQDQQVPEVLKSGNHQEIERWQRRKSLIRTMEQRPDLLLRAKLSAQDLKLLPLERAKWEEKE